MLVDFVIWLVNSVCSLAQLVSLAAVFWMSRNAPPKELRGRLLPQRAKKVVSDSLGLVDFAIGLVNSVLNLPTGK